MSTYNTLLDEFKDLAERQGWTVRKGGNDHWQFLPKNGGHPMVTASSTPSDPNAIHNVRRDLIASGLKIPGDREQHMERRARKAIQPTVKQFFKDHPDQSYTTADVIMYVKAKLGADVGSGSVSVALGALAEQGYLIRLNRGEYRYKKPLPDPLPTFAVPQAPMRRTVDITEYATNTEDERILNEALAALGKIQDEVNDVLTRALTSLGQIEEVVRRNRDVARLLVELKEKLK